MLIISRWKQEPRLHKMSVIIQVREATNYLYSNSQYSILNPLKELILYQRNSKILKGIKKAKYVTFLKYFSHVYVKQMNWYLEDLLDKRSSLTKNQAFICKG